MRKKLLRWPVGLVVAALLLVMLVTSLPLLHNGKSTAAHASGGGGGTATLSVSSSIVQPGGIITVSGQGFASQDYVGLFIDAPYYEPFTVIIADANGNISSKVKLPTSGVVQGLHALVANGFYSGVIGETPLTFTPHLFTASGKPGLPVQATGAAFAANESVQIKMGSILEGTTVTNSTGDLSFSFNVPSKQKQGTYLLTAVRTNQKPKVVTSQLVIIPAMITAPAGIHDGQLVKAFVTGFLSQESVTVSWNANGGQQLTTVQTDGKGAAQAWFNPPLVAAGSYTLTAVGSTSKISATAPMNVGPGIQIQFVYSGSSAGTKGYSGGGYGSGVPGSTIHVIGGGFTAGETVKVYFQTTTNGVVSATVDATGVFTVALTLPTTYNPGVSYYVYAVSTSSKDKARAPFSFTPATLYADAYVIGNSPLQLYGYGFAVNETIKLYWNYQQTGQTQLTSVTADSYGSFFVTVTPPTTAYQGNVTIAAVGVTSHLTATSSVSQEPSISISPAIGKPGTTVQVSGVTFDTSQSVTITFGGVTVATTTTKADGTFSTSFVVPAPSNGGNPIIIASDASGTWSSIFFSYKPTLKITPTTGSAGTMITVSGTLFSSYAPITLFWKDITTPKNPKYINLGTFSTDSNGTFSATITAPSNLVSGQKYYVLANDGDSYLWVQVAFTAQ